MDDVVGVGAGVSAGVGTFDVRVDCVLADVVVADVVDVVVTGVGAELGTFVVS
jgi:hypothetical protein